MGETPGDRLRIALEMADAGIEMMRLNLRRSHPQASVEEIEGLLVAWLHRRPGATHGDCPGQVRTLVLE